MKVLLAFAVLFCTESIGAWLWSRQARQKGPEWDGLRVTYGIIFSGYDRMPRDEQSAIGDGWTKDKNCSVTNGFVGNRYILKGDTAVMLLFDNKGYIAGIQAGIPKGKPYPSSNIKSWFIEEKKMYTITAYFVNPELICGVGRTGAQFEQQGTGTGLWLQTGPNPTRNVTQIPQHESDIPATKWTKGRCFPSMGVHYWYDSSADMRCDTIKPIFLMYNKGKLNAFGWAFGTYLSSSTRYEHPPKWFAKWVMDPAPNCLLTSGSVGLTTMHVFLTSSPRTRNLC